MHLDNKTLSDRGTVFREAIACVLRHLGYVPFQWMVGISFLSRYGPPSLSSP